MTVAVVETPAGVKVVGNADDLQVDGGALIVDDENGKYIAVFAPGEWDNAVLKDEASTIAVDATPRVWKSVFDIPVRTLVERPDGRQLFIVAEGQGWFITPTSPLWHAVKLTSGWRLTSEDNDAGPFTEVLK